MRACGRSRARRCPPGAPGPQRRRPGAVQAPPADAWPGDRADGEPPILAEREATSPHELTARRLALLLEATKRARRRGRRRRGLRPIVGGGPPHARRRPRGDPRLRGGDDADAAARSSALVGARSVGRATSRVPGAPPLPRSMPAPALARRAALLTVDAAADPRFVGQSVLRQRVRSAHVRAAARGRRRALGALYVDSADRSAHVRARRTSTSSRRSPGSRPRRSRTRDWPSGCGARPSRARTSRATSRRRVAERIARSTEPARLGRRAAHGVGAVRRPARLHGACRAAWRPTSWRRR